MPSLPSIRDLSSVFSEGLHGFRFIQPEVGRELEPLHVEDSALSLSPKIMSIRKLTLQPNTVVPVHVHYEKEKVYTGLCVGAELQIVVWAEDGSNKTFLLQQLSQTVAVPPGRPHALIYSGKRPASFLVITTSQNPKDIDWESGILELLKNKHLNNAAASA